MISLKHEAKKKKIEMLSRLSQIDGSLIEIVEFLLQEKLIDKEMVKSLQKSGSFARDLESAIQNLRNAEKLQFVEYEWVVLPHERIKLTLVTDKITKEFGFEF